jgi:hypothetical protein
MIGLVLGIVLGLALLGWWAVRKTLRAFEPQEFAKDSGRAPPPPPEYGSAYATAPVPEPAPAPAVAAAGAAVVAATATAAAMTPAVVGGENGSEPVETCEVVWWRGYRRSAFTAVAFDSDGLPYDVARSPDFKWTRPEQPPRETTTVDARERLVAALVADGWEEVGPGEGWYGAYYQRKPADAWPAAEADDSETTRSSLGTAHPDLSTAKPLVS